MSIDAYIRKAEKSYVLEFPEEGPPEKNSLWSNIIRYISGKRDKYKALFKKAEAAERVTVQYPPELSLEEAVEAYQGIVAKRVRRHQVYMAINTALGIITFPTPVPFITVFFGSLVAKSTYNMQIARMAAERAEFVPYRAETGLEDIVEVRDEQQGGYR